MSVVSVDATHNNPVLNAFIWILYSENQAKPQSTLIQDEQHSHNTVLLNVLGGFRKITPTEHYSDVSSLRAPLIQAAKADTNRAIKWWLLAYTLIRNPSLIELRKRSGLRMNNMVDPDVSRSDLV